MRSRKHDKYILNDMQIERECYQITATFLASERIHLLQRQSSNWAVKRFILTEQTLIKELLISLSIKLRIMDDLMRFHEKSGYLRTQNNRTGVIEEKDETKNLTLREACNKIIHANRVEFKLQYSQHGSKRIRFLAPELSLHGKRGRTSWTATVKILRLISAALELSSAYEQAWDVSAYE